MGVPSRAKSAPKEGGERGTDSGFYPDRHMSVLDLDFDSMFEADLEIAGTPPEEALDD